MKKNKLLFIEDDLVTGQAYKYHFTVAGYEVELCEDGASGLKALSRIQPDVVVLDLMLPRFNGLEIIRQIRGNPATRTLPVIVFTNGFDKDVVRSAALAGANQCLIKAETNPEAVLTAIERALNPQPIGSSSSSLSSGDESAYSPARHDSSVALAEFRRTAPKGLLQLRDLIQKLLSVEEAEARRSFILELHHAVRGLSGQAAMAGVRSFASMASALETLLKEMDDRPQMVNASSLRTVRQAILFLESLLDDAAVASHHHWGDFRIMVVDDDPVSREALKLALERAYLTPACFEDPLEAFESLKQQSYDLVITDLSMPGLDGFQLCKRMRSLPLNSTTPVIFVTALDGFASHLNAARSGGSDFIAKPFHFLELAVKALMATMQSKLNAGSSNFHRFVPGGV